MRQSRTQSGFEQYVLWMGLALTFPVLLFVDIGSLRPAEAGIWALAKSIALGFVTIFLITRLEIRSSIRIIAMGIVMILSVMPAVNMTHAEVDLPAQDAVPSEVEKAATGKPPSRAAPVQVEAVPAVSRSEAVRDEHAHDPGSISAKTVGIWTTLPDGRHRYSWSLEKSGVTYWCGVVFADDITPAAERMIAEQTKKSEAVLARMGNSCVP